MPPAAADDSRILNAARQAIERHGWRDSTLERIAEEAGLSRMTLHRRGITRDGVLAGLARRLEDDYRAALWAALTAPGNARERLEHALDTICDLSEANLELFAALGDAPRAAIFHEPEPGVPGARGPGGDAAGVPGVRGPGGDAAGVPGVRGPGGDAEPRAGVPGARGPGDAPEARAGVPGARPGADAEPRAGDGVLTRSVFTEPIERILRDGAADGSLRVVDPVETATVIFNLVSWTYRHLRRGHGWPPERARRGVLSISLDGLAA